MDPRGILKAFPKRRKIYANPPSNAPAKIPKRQEGEAAGEWLSSLRAHIVPTGIGRARAELFQKQIIQHGGQVCPAQDPGVTHIVVDEAMDCERALRLLGLPELPRGTQLVKSAWLSLCLRERRLVDTASFIPSRNLDQPQPSKADQDSSASPGTHEVLLTAAFSSPRGASPPQKAEEGASTQAQSSSDDEASDVEGPHVSAADLEALISGHYPTPPEENSGPNRAPEALEKWVCAQPSSRKVTNHNLHITEKLEVLANAYSVQGDKWRALGYTKAISALKSFHKPVSSYQEACSIPGVGKRMAEKIMEILESGHLRKLDHISESVPTLELFSNIWGAGTKTAWMWYHQGFRSLEDIRNLASLTGQQAVGLKHYSDFLERMPREEAAEIEQTEAQEGPEGISRACLSEKLRYYRRCPGCRLQGPRNLCVLGQRPGDICIRRSSFLLVRVTRLLRRVPEGCGQARQPAHRPLSACFPFPLSVVFLCCLLPVLLLRLQRLLMSSPLSSSSVPRLGCWDQATGFLAPAPSSAEPHRPRHGCELRESSAPLPSRAGILGPRSSACPFSGSQGAGPGDGPAGAVRAPGSGRAPCSLRRSPAPLPALLQVRVAAQALSPGLLCVACGSYRRGKLTCGDVDVLLTHPDGRSHQGIFSRLLDKLRQQGFLTDDLVSQEDHGQQQKYLGVCQLPGPGRRHRRLDIIVVPYSEFACALLYFTGSAHFNRSMRALAKTKGMSLSEHALRTAVVRSTQGAKVRPGQVLPTPTEKDVFQLLGLPYRAPAERDW